MFPTAELSPELEVLSREIEVVARAAGLSFFDVVFQSLDARDVNAVAAYGGFPVRYPSWRFGMEYERLDKGYSWGLSKIYELVINNDPTYAYLVRSNSLMEQKLVMAHVFGHADFFRHNVWFAPTERKMVDVMAADATRIRRHVDAHGQDVVEAFLDVALGLDNLIDPYLPLRELRARRAPARPVSPLDRARQSFEAVSAGRPASDESASVSHSGSSLPTLDVLGFLIEEADLCEWQRDVLRIVRREAYYFAPQRMTKIMNEGWASFWHSRILTRSVLSPGEVIDFADCHSGATAAQPGQLNPYKLGIELFRYAEESGRDLFQLRAVHNDVSFLDELVDEEFATRSELFLYSRNPRTGRREVTDRDWRAVKSQLLGQLASGGMPQIELVERDFGGAGELLLRHRFDGRELQLEQAGQTLQQLARLWKRRCHLETRSEGEALRLSSDGGDVSMLELAARAQATEDADADERLAG
jgi:stage V sporulation protein R